VRQKAKKMEAIHVSYSLEHGREPTDEEVAEQMGLTIDQYNQALIDCSWVTVSLDGLLDRDSSDEGSAPTELPADPNEEDFTQRLEKRQLIDALTGAVKQLPEREWLIVSLYYRDEMTMKEIAQILEISESRVCQLHGRALGRLRARLARERGG
jgi:RNA polymerase sigma factor for flagellar operon FliA